MENKYEEMVRAAFEKEKKQVHQDVEEIYRNVCLSASAKPEARIIADIIDKESDQIISYINKLVSKIKEKSAQLAEQNGCGDASGMIWANVEIQTGVPEAKLCHTEKIVMPHTKDTGSKRTSYSESRKNAREIEKLEKDRNRFIETAVVGAVVEAATLLIVPGWDAKAAIAHIAGIIVMGVGVAGAIDRQGKINSKNRLYKSSRESAKPSFTEDVSKRQTEKVVSDICSRQADCNEKIICAWIDKVCEALVLQFGEYAGQ